jgi:hypothetical protein
MEIGSEKRAGPKRIGELLVSANIVRPESILQGLKESKASNRPLGRVLMGMGVLKERDLEAALELQSLLREGLVSNQFGIRALNLAIRSDIPLAEGFRKLGWQPPERPPASTNELAQLLLDAQLVPRKQMDEALARSTSAKIPLGRCLVLNRIISSSLLSSALTAQVMLRDEKITRTQAIAALKAAFRKQQPLEQSLQESGEVSLSEPGLKVGDLLTAAGLVTEGDKMSAIEQGLVNELPVGQVLLRQGRISQSVLDDALKIQQLVNMKTVTSHQGTELLRTAHARGVSVEAIMAEWQAKQREIERAFKSTALLEKAGILTAGEVGRAQAKTVQHRMVVLDLLRTSGRLPAQLLDAAMRADSLVDNQVIDSEQAVAVLIYCQKHNVDFHHALQNTPWDSHRGPTPESSAPQPQTSSATQEQNSTWSNSPWSKAKRNTGEN